MDHFIPATYQPPAPKEDVGIQADFMDTVKSSLKELPIENF
jgi:hypothetical protein